MIGNFIPGQTVTVYLAPGLRVPRSPETPQQFLGDGDEVVWNDWIHNKVQEGALLLTDPRQRYHVDGKELVEQPEAEKAEAPAPAATPADPAAPPSAPAPLALPSHTTGDE